MQCVSILIVNLLSCYLFCKCIVTMTVAARTEASAAAHLLVLQVRIPLRGLDVSLF